MDGANLSSFDGFPARTFRFLRGLERNYDKAWFALKNHSGFPVVEKKKVVGIATSMQLIKRQKGRLVRESGGLKTTTRVRSLMFTTKGEGAKYLVKPTTPIEEAADKIIRLKRTNILPVVDKELVGVVTRKDLLRGYV